jgi:ribonuclease D
MSELPSYDFITDAEGLARFCDENKDCKWLAFDTEFIGERRYTPLLCLLQVATVNGLYMIDPIKIKDISPFLDIIQDEQIEKITHAGENDYLLLYNLFGIVPKNVYDTQIAAGFLGFGYPVSFQKLLAKELRVSISKTHTVTDWEKRPMAKQQILYALNDVIHLPSLWQRQKRALESVGRWQWAKEECSKWESPDFFQSSPRTEALDNSLIYSLSPQEQIFMVRLYEWREVEAKSKNQSREMVLPSKLISVIVRIIGSGKKNLMDDRRISQKTFKNYWEVFNELYQRKLSDEDRDLLASVPEPYDEENDQSTLLDLLNFVMKYKCQQNNVSPALLLPRAEFNLMKKDKAFFPSRLASGWRHEVLGDDFLEWLRKRNPLSITLSGNRCTLEMED